MTGLRWERFGALDALAAQGLVHGFTLRQPGVDVVVDRDEALRRLDASFVELVDELGLDSARLFGAKQVHGDGLAWVPDGVVENRRIAAVDGLLTEQVGCALEILVADCCAVFLVDPGSRRCGLIHSGRKGTELDIAGRALDQLLARPGADPYEIVVQLSPCIGPPYYEVDFAASIREQILERGIRPENLHGPPANTGADLERYYSYRVERGRTGRMMALLGWRDEG